MIEKHISNARCVNASLVHFGATCYDLPSKYAVKLMYLAPNPACSSAI